jgi:predicted Zn-dependent protease
MNHFKTFIFFLFLAICGLSVPVSAQLQRPLRPAEIQILLQNVKEDPTNLKSRLFLGNHYYNQNQWKKVVQYLGPVTEQLPDVENYKLAYAYLNTGDHRQAEAIAKILMSRESVKTSSYLLSVEIYSKILDKIDNPKIRKPIHDQLFETLKTVKAKDPENPKIYDVWLEKLEAYVEHYAFEALRVMEDMKENKIRFYPHHYSLLCKYNFLAKFTSETKTSCKKAIIVQPDNPSNHIYLGQTHVNIGEEKVGKRMLASVGKKFANSEEALYAAADSYHKSGNIGLAFQYYKKASANPNAQAEVFMGLAETAFDLKKYGVALQAYTRHCFLERKLHHNFRRASGLLKDQPQWQNLYRQRMLDCNTPNDERK